MARIVSLEEKFYVYIYFDPMKPGTFTYGNLTFNYEPFYVGKGCNGRMDDHLYNAKRMNKGGKSPVLNKCWSLITKFNCEPIISKYETGLTEDIAFWLEIQLIAEIGRRNMGKGPLLNLTDGGDGVSGGRWHLSKEIRESRSIARKGKPGYPRSKESIEKGAQKLRGRKQNLTDEERREKSERMKGDKNPMHGGPSPEHRLAIGIATKKRLENPENHPMYKKHHKLESRKLIGLHHVDNSGEKHYCFGKHSWNYNTHPPEETKQRQSVSAKLRHVRERQLIVEYLCYSLISCYYRV